MKINRRTVLSTAAVLGVAALIAGGTIAYFTDKTDPVTNQFTVGDVKIEMYESQLHRQNSGRQGSFGALASDPDYCDWNANPNDSGLDTNTGLIKGSYERARYCTPGMNANEGDASTITAVENGHTRTGFSNANRTWGYKDSTIESDAADYQTGYFARVSRDIVPGQWVRKFTYVKNTDNENANYEGGDAYVLIRYMVPTEYADDLELKIPGTPYEEDTDASTDGIQAYFYAVDRNSNTGRYSAHPLTEVVENNETKWIIDDATSGYKGYIQTIDNVEYKVYAAVTTEAVKPGEMTFWSPVNTIRLKTDRQNSDPNAANYVASGAIREVKVDAQAIQAKTFADAIEAINAL